MDRAECEQRAEVRGDFKNLNLALRSGWRRGWVMHSRQGHSPKKEQSKAKYSCHAVLW